MKKKYFNKALLIVVSFVVICVLAIVLWSNFTQKVQAAWYHDNWAYRQAILFENSSGSALTDFQIKFTIDTSTLVAAGKMQSDCDDLRVTDYTGETSLSYWIEPTTCNTATTYVWVKVSSVPVTPHPQAVIYFYYGNVSASAGSSASGTFIYDIDNVYGAWTMDETSGSTKVDLSGQGNDLTDAGSQNAGSAVAVYDNGADFEDGLAMRLRRTDNTSLSTGDIDFTVSFWYKPESLAGTGSDTIVTKGGGVAGQIEYQVIYSSSGVFQFLQYPDGSTQNTISASTFGAPSAGNWYFILVWHDSVNNVRGICINGVCDSNSYTSGIADGTNDFSVGSLSTGGNKSDGIVDSLRFYKTVLTSAQRAAFYDTGVMGIFTTNYAGHELVAKYVSGSSPSMSGLVGEETRTAGPVASWRFDEGTGTTANDSSSNQNTGTLAGATIPTWQSEDLCVLGKCLYFNGITSNVTAGTVSDVKTISFWVKSATASASLIGLATGVDVKATGGLIQTDGITSPTIYVNGQNVSGTSATPFVANQWNHVTVTTATGITANAITLGKMQTGVLNGFLDEVKLYNYSRSADQVKLDYNNSGINRGAGVILGANPAQVNKSLSNGLVGYWKMDEASGDAVDASGNGYTLTNTGTATFTTGKYANSGSFNGSSQYQTIASASAPNLVMSPTQSFTVSGWVNPASVAAGDKIPISKAEVTTGPSREYYFVMNSGLVGFIISTDGGSPGVYCSSGLLPYMSTANTWYFLAGWYDATTRTAGFQVNGQVLWTAPCVGPYQGSAPFRIGAAANSGGGISYWNGKVDEVRVYRRALSNSERMLLYNFAPGPVGYWEMEEGTGTTVSDSSGNGYTSSAFSGNTAWAQGKFGKGLYFDGNADYVSLADANAKLDVGATTDSYSVSAWMRTTVDNAGNSAIIEKNDGSGAYPFNLYLDSSEFACFQISDGTNSPSTCGSTSMKDGLWHHYTGVRDVFNDKIYVYVDGVLINSTADTTTATTANNDNTTIGNGGTSYTAHDLAGWIDEVKVYNYARNSKQVIEDVNGGHPVGGSPVGSQAGYWKFDEGFGTTAYNSISGGTSGTLNGMAEPASIGISGWNPNGVFNKALSFDGSNDDVSFGDLTYSEGASTLSWSFWVNPRSLSTQDCLLCKYNNAASQRSWAIETDGSDSSILRVTIPTTTSEADGTTMAQTPTGVLVNGVWKFVTVVYDGTQTGNANRLNVFVNGVKQNLAYTGTIPAATLATTSNAVAGESSDGSRNFSGNLDELKIYYGALTDSDINIDYNRGQAMNLGTLGVSTVDGKTASNSAGAAYCVPGDTSTCNLPSLHWNFEEGFGGSAYDISGNNNTGTWAGTGDRYTAGVTGKGASFNGSDSIITASGLANAFFTASWTQELWIKTTTVSNLVVTEKGTNNAFIQTSPTAGQIRAGAGVGAANDYTDTTGAPAINNGSWHHIAVTYNGSANIVLIYIDGKVRGTTTATNDSASSATAYAVGARVGPSAVFSGQLDDVRVYDSVRTPAQIAYDYNRGLPISWWKMDQCQGGTLYDSIGTASATITIGATDQASTGTCTTNANTFWYNGRTGKYNYSGNFDGDDDYAATDNLAMIIANGSTSTNVSWGGWFKPATSVASKTLIHKTNEFRLTTDANSKPVCEIYSGSWQTGATGHTALPLAAWSHVLCTYDGSAIRTYVNGLQVGTTTETDSLTGTANALNIGRNSASTYYEGQIDDVKIWNYGLTTYQIRSEFNQGAAVRFGPTSGAP